MSATNPEASQPVVTPASAQPPQRFRLTRQASVSLIITALVIIIALVAGFFYHQKKMLQTKSPYSYTYSKLSLYSVAGRYSGTGMSFIKPNEYTRTSPTDDTRITHHLKRNNKAFSVGSIVVKSLNPVPSFPDTYLKSLRDSKNPAYQVLVSEQKQFIEKSIGSSFTVNVSDAKTLTTQNLKSNAWSDNITATPKDKTQPSYKGEGVLAVGSHAIYYFMIDNTDYNWDNNQAIWQKVIDSLKIDL